MVKPVILQVVGYQNSGKTTFVHSLLYHLKQEDLRVGTIKHHGHGGKPDVFEEKDSSRYSAAGAHVSMVEGEGRLLIQADKESWSLEEQIEILNPFNLDVIIIEGHKYQQYPKVIIINEESDISLLSELTNIKFVFFRNVEVRDLVVDKSISHCLIDEKLKCFELIKGYINRELSND
jgi:molybdopterin-guanine dinucleotide biosynthesis adapter protein